METGYREEIDERLTGILSHFYVIKTDVDKEGSLHHLSPSLEMMLVFNFGTPVSFSFGEKEITRHAIHKIGIFGPMRKMLNYHIKPGNDLLVLNFTLNGFYRFFSEPMEHFSDEHMFDPDLLIQKNRLEKMWEMMNMLPSATQRIELMTQYLLSDLRESDPETLPLLEAASYFHSAQVSPVKAIADKAALTERTVQSRFKRYVGYSSKELLRFLRFKKVLYHILTLTGNLVDWAALVEGYGYHDQSHLIKDFKYYTGVSPRQFMKLNEQDGFCMSTEIN
jgi:AraC-like DNA-binding protein